MDDAMMNELLLVCSSIGNKEEIEDDRGELRETFVRGENCIEWVHDLQRAIRRDDPVLKPIAITLGQWNVLQTKLLPLIVNHRDDSELVFSLMKILVMLTMKPEAASPTAVRQAEILINYKAAFLQGDVVAILVSTIQDALAHEGTARTEEDNLRLELLITLIRNLLAVPDSPQRVLQDLTNLTRSCRTLHDEFLLLLEREHVLTLFLYIAQDIDSRENRDWNLLLLEVFGYIVRDVRPCDVVAEWRKKDMLPFTQTENQKDNGSSRPGDKEGASKGKLDLGNKPLRSGMAALQIGNALLDGEKDHRARVAAASSSRHSRFGFYAKVTGCGGRTQLLTNPFKKPTESLPQDPTTSETGSPLDNVPTCSGPAFYDSPHIGQVLSLLVDVCKEFLASCYTPLLTSLKAEFQRESAKLLPSDRPLLFRVVSFFAAVSRLSQHHIPHLEKLRKKRREKEREENFKKFGLEQALEMERRQKTEDGKEEDYTGFTCGPMMATLDLFFFRFVLQSIETYIDRKETLSLVSAVSVLKELLSTLSEMYFSKDRRNAQISNSLTSKLFYEREILDLIPKLLKSVGPEMKEWNHCGNLIEMTHVTLKILEASSKQEMKILSRVRKVAKKDKKKKKKKKKGEEGENKERASGDEEDESEEDSEEEDEDRREEQLMREMQRREVDFQFTKYILSLTGHSVVSLFASVLQCYYHNPPRLNHYVLSFYRRLQKYEIDENEYEDPKPTLEPLTLNIRVLLAADKILSDRRIYKAPQFEDILRFCRDLVMRLERLVDRNPLFLVELLLPMRFPLKACASIQRVYEGPPGPPELPHEQEEEGGEGERQLGDENDKEKGGVQGSNSDQDSDQEAEFGDGDSTQPSAEQGAQPKKRNKGRAKSKARPNGPSKKRTTTKRWTQEEDDAIREIYPTMKDLPSVFEIMALEDVFQEKERSAEQISRRVAYLKLNQKKKVVDEAAIVVASTISRKLRNSTKNADRRALALLISSLKDCVQLREDEGKDLGNHDYAFGGSLVIRKEIGHERNAGSPTPNADEGHTESGEGENGDGNAQNDQEDRVGNVASRGVEDISETPEKSRDEASRATEGSEEQEEGSEENAPTLAAETVEEEKKVVIEGLPSASVKRLLQRARVQKLLKALKFSAPTNNYPAWRIPKKFSAADLKKIENVLEGKKVEVSSSSPSSSSSSSSSDGSASSAADSSSASEAVSSSEQEQDEGQLEKEARRSDGTEDDEDDDEGRLEKKTTPSRLKRTKRKAKQSKHGKSSRERRKAERSGKPKRLRGGRRHRNSETDDVDSDSDADFSGDDRISKTLAVMTRKSKRLLQRMERDIEEKTTMRENLHSDDSSRGSNSSGRGTEGSDSSEEEMEFGQQHDDKKRRESSRSDKEDQVGSENGKGTDEGETSDKNDDESERKNRALTGSRRKEGGEKRGKELEKRTASAAKSFESSADKDQIANDDSEDSGTNDEEKTKLKESRIQKRKKKKRKSSDKDKHRRGNTLGRQKGSGSGEKDGAGLKKKSWQVLQAMVKGGPSTASDHEDQEQESQEEGSDTEEGQPRLKKLKTKGAGAKRRLKRLRRATNTSDSESDTLENLKSKKSRESPLQDASDDRLEASRVDASLRETDSGLGNVNDKNVTENSADRTVGVVMGEEPVQSSDRMPHNASAESHISDRPDTMDQSQSVPEDESAQTELMAEQGVLLQDQGSKETSSAEIPVIQSDENTNPNMVIKTKAALIPVNKSSAGKGSASTDEGLPTVCPGA